jgi:hypothetical protein
MKMWISCVSLLALCLAIGPARGQEGAIGLDWQRNHAPAGMSLENRAAALLADGALAVLGQQRPLAHLKDKTADQGWIGVFATDGSLRREWSFVLRAGDAALQDVDSFAAVGDGFVVAGVRTDGESVLVALGPDGAVRKLRSLGSQRAAFILALPGGDLVLGGRDRRDLYASRLRADGGVVWERQLDRGFDELFLDGVLRNDDVVMLEHSGIREQFFMREARVGLTIMNKARDSIRAPDFATEGRAGAVVAAGAGYAMLFDTGVGVKQNLRFVLLDAAFKAVATAELAAIPFSLERARLARRAERGYLVAALDGTRLLWLELGPAGAVVARQESARGRAFLHPDAVGGERTYGVATELLEVPGANEVRKVLYLVKFSSR